MAREDGKDDLEHNVLPKLRALQEMGFYPATTAKAQLSAAS